MATLLAQITLDPATRFGGRTRHRDAHVRALPRDRSRHLAHLAGRFQHDSRDTPVHDRRIRRQGGRCVVRRRRNLRTSAREDRVMSAADRSSGDAEQLVRPYLPMPPAAYPEAPSSGGPATSIGG